MFKLVELNGEPRMKLSEDMGKVTIPGKKNVYRYGFLFVYGKSYHSWKEKCLHVRFVICLWEKLPFLERKVFTGTVFYLFSSVVNRRG